MDIADEVPTRDASAPIPVAEKSDFKDEFARLRMKNKVVKSAELVQRSFYLSQCPPESANLPEFAVFGRSNVGKSSLINFMMGRKLLTTSKHPGHTKLIQHILVNKSYYIVDLPGVGFANGAGKDLKAMDRIVTTYVRRRQTLVHMLYLVDSTVPPMQIDLEGIKWLADSGTHISVVFTKCDKDQRRNCTTGPIEALSEALWDMKASPWRLGHHRELPEMFLTSSKAKTGREFVLAHLADMRSRCRQRTVRKARNKDRHKDGAFAAELPPAIR